VPQPGAVLGHAEWASSNALAFNVEQVRWVCGPYRCGWRPNYYYWGPRWRHGWRRG
jgi:hypothetical protein